MVGVRDGDYFPCSLSKFFAVSLRTDSFRFSSHWLIGCSSWKIYGTALLWLVCDPGPPGSSFWIVIFYMLHLCYCFPVAVGEPLYPRGIGSVYGWAQVTFSGVCLCVRSLENQSQYSISPHLFHCKTQRQSLSVPQPHQCWRWCLWVKPCATPGIIKEKNINNIYIKIYININNI